MTGAVYSCTMKYCVLNDLNTLGLLTLYFYQPKKDVTYNRSNNSKVPVVPPTAPKSQRKEKRERDIAFKEFINMIPNNFKE